MRQQVADLEQQFWRKIGAALKAICEAVDLNAHFWVGFVDVGDVGVLS